MKRFIDRLMARLGYVPVEQVNNLRAAIDGLTKSIDIRAASVPLKIEVDDSQVREVLALLEQVVGAAAAAELALSRVRDAAPRAEEALAAANRLAGFQKLAQQTSSIGTRLISEAAAAEARKESRQTD
jgi:hypothetical protein